jgi:ATP synthase protein I
VPELPGKQSETREGAFGRNVGAQERRMLASRRTRAHVWFGLGLFGLIGWSVAVPTLLGALLGSWLDRRHLGGRSWTLPLLIAGLCLGCANAWHWVSKEQSEVRRRHEDQQ